MDRVEALERALRIAITAVSASRNMLEEMSAGDCVPTVDTIRRLHDLMSDAMSVADAMGIDPFMREPPED